MTVTLQAKFNKFIHVLKASPDMKSFVKSFLQLIFAINHSFDIQFNMFECKLPIEAYRGDHPGLLRNPGHIRSLNDTIIDVNDIFRWPQMLRN